MRITLVDKPERTQSQILMGQPAPAWLREGVPHLLHDEHIRERTKMLK